MLYGMVNMYILIHIIILFSDYLHPVVHPDFYPDGVSILVVECLYVIL